MAIVQCPNCGEPISNRAKKCIHCGFEFTPQEREYCADCGAELEKGAAVCTKCGCPVEKDESTSSVVPQKVEVTRINVTEKAKKAVAIFVVIMVILLITVFGIQQIQKQNAAKEAERAAIEAAEEAERVSQEYSENIKLATITILSGAANAETCGNLIIRVWRNAIYEERDSDTDKYTRPNGRWVSDFNEALKLLFSESGFTSKITNIESDQERVQSLMKNLKNPPAEYKDAYDAISKLYDAYVKLSNLAVNPTGNLQTFSQNFNDADTETSNCYSAMKIYLD